MLNRQLQRLINTGVRNDGLLNLSANDFFNTTVAVPPVAEQEAIADVMRSIDDEIKIYDRQARALRQQKKGLMQRLLTREVRVGV